MTARQRLVLIVAILASGVAFLDGSIVNVALPAIQRELGGGLATQQWVVDAYLITLGALILIAGSLSDLFGRRRVLTAGLQGFLITSLLCAMAPTAITLISARALQGIAGALLVPSSLAVIMSAFKGKALGRAIGLWTAWTGIAYILGPLLGGFLVDNASWRLIFAVNVVPIVVTWALLRRMKTDPEQKQRVAVDVRGALLCAFGLGDLVYGLIEQPRLGWHHPAVYVSLVTGVVLFSMFVVYERQTAHPMLPFTLFRHRNFTAGNLATAAIYACWSASLFIVLFLQQVCGLSAFKAGLSLLPIVLLLLSLSPRFGALAGKFGPRWFMAGGPLSIAAGTLLLWRATVPVQYWTQVFPGTVLYGFGLAMTVAPLTSAVLGEVPEHQSGIASAINNAVARVAGLLAVAAIGAALATQFSVSLRHQLQVHPPAKNLTSSEIKTLQNRSMDVQLPAGLAPNDASIVRGDLVRTSVDTFRYSLLLFAGLLILGGGISAVGIRNHTQKPESI